MKEQCYFNSHNLIISCLPFLLLIMHSYQITAFRPSQTNRGEEVFVIDNYGVSSQAINKLEENKMMEIEMGIVEDCGNGYDNEEACLKRRMILDAHLDYIYTQHHKP